MGYNYRQILCDNCKEITVHQIRRTGSPGRGTKRTVTKCLACQTKTVENRRKGKYKVIGEIKCEKKQE